MTTDRSTGWRIVIAGGGTGGHLHPGIAVAREFLRRDPRAQISFAGTAAGLEARVVPREGFDLDVIRSAGLKGKSLMARVRGVWLLPLGGVDAWRVLSRRRPGLVIGVGGYSSGPLVAMALLRRIPTLLLEQNAVPGLTNRLLAPLADAAAVTYEVTLRYFGAKGFVSGNPVRPEFFENGEEGGRETETFAAAPSDARVLVFGGSQGAHAINVAMVEAAARLAAAGGIEIVHQTGKEDVGMVRDAYRRAGLPARVEEFLYEMHREMRQADLVVSRAGATTLAEIAAAGRASLLIPLPTATDDHQRRNADVLARRGAAVVIDQRDLTGDRLAEALEGLLADEPRRMAMGLAARQFARPDAARVIVDRALALLEATRQT